MAAALASAPVAARPASTALQISEEKKPSEIVVIGVPLSGRIPLDRIPASVQTISSSLDEPGKANLSDLLNQRIGGVSAFDSLGNPLQQGITLRGFTAAPVLGEPQGLVVFQGAMRANEAFGDVVQWDLLPIFAVANVQVIAGSNPVYGRNSIGGAIALEMKDGFDSHGVDFEAAVGSFGRRTATVQFGAATGDFGIYAGADVVKDDGWRDVSPSHVVRSFSDITWRSGDASIGLSVTAAESVLSGNGPAPLDLLAERRAAVFTFPDVTDSRLLAAALRGTVDPHRGVSLSGGAFYRRLERETRNGDQAEFTSCKEFTAIVADFAAPVGSYCFGAEIKDEEEDKGQETEVDGTPVVLVGPDGRALGPLAETPDSIFNQTRTLTDAWGANSELTVEVSFKGMANIAVAGAALHAATTHYRSGADLGVLSSSRGVESLGLAIGNQQFNVGLQTFSEGYSAYISNTLSLLPKFHVTAALRWNRVKLRLRDQIGTALNGDHGYSRLNPAIGVAWNVTPGLTTYVSFTKNNRIPTPAELSCADPQRPCRFPNAFLADPPLADVEATTMEVGGRGRLQHSWGRVDYAFAAFKTASKDDIIFISAGPIVGTGYFDNVGKTRRSGIELNLTGAAGPVTWHISYALLDASFASPLSIQAPDNPASDENGEIHVTRGDRIPAIPRHSLKAGARVAISKRFSVGGDLTVSSARFLRGDEANLQRPLSGFSIVNAVASYRMGPLQWFGRIDNLLDAEYRSFGIYGDAEELGYGNPRFVSPGAPRTLLFGFRLGL